MHRFWDTIIEPVLEALQPKTVVEIGSDQGSNTRKLLEFCQQHDTKLHVIDPLPKYDVAAWQEQYDEHLVFHKALSLDALPTIDRFDVVLIDGDHNWYTVFNELKLIEERCKESSQQFPLVMLHDIGWPYGRRDLYYDPETIPEEYRKPYEQSGIRPESEELVGGGGLNLNFANSVSENDPQNGVLTAVEDFLEETELEIELIQIPGLHGLGVLVPLQLKEQNEKLAGFVEVLNLPPTVARYIQLIEEARLEMEISRQEQSMRAKRLKTRLRKQEQANRKQEEATKALRARNEELGQGTLQLTDQNRELEQRASQLSDQNRELEQRASQLTEQNKELEQRASQLTEQNRSLRQQLQDIQDSRSWQLLNSLGRIRAKVSRDNKTR